MDLPISLLDIKTEVPQGDPLSIGMSQKLAKQWTVWQDMGTTVRWHQLVAIRIVVHGSCVVTASYV